MVCSLSQKEITEMECDLLVPHLKDEGTMALVKENIKHIADGFHSACGDVLTTVLEKAFDYQEPVSVVNYSVSPSIPLPITPR